MVFTGLYYTFEIFSICKNNVVLKILVLWVGIYSFIFKCSETLISETTI